MSSSSSSSFSSSMDEKKSEGLNLYIQKTMKNFVSYHDLANEVIHKGASKQRNAKSILTNLRQLSLFNAPNQVFDMTLARSLILMTKDSSNDDNNRKIVRSAYFLLTEILLNAPSDTPTLGDMSSALMDQLLADTKSASDSRLCLSWRLLSRLAFVFHRVNLIENALHTSFKQLKYPEKENRILFGKKKATQDFENQLHFWSCLFSSMRRARLVPPVDCIGTVFIACKSSHTLLSRHAFYLLQFFIEKHPADLCSTFHTALKDGNVLSRASADVHSCIYLMEACKAFIVSLEKQNSHPKDAIVINDCLIPHTSEF